VIYLFNAKSFFIDFSDYPLVSLKDALRKLRELKTEGYPIDADLLEALSTEIIDRNTGFKTGAD